MDKEQATRILAKELGSRLERTVIIEDSYKDRLVKSASSAYQIMDPLMLSFYDNKFHLEKTKDKNVPEVMMSHNCLFAEANYFFMTILSDNKRASKCSNFLVTSYALIGEKEKTALKKLFYKNVKSEILGAMETLGVENFVSLYEQYSHDASPFSKILNDLKSIKKFINDSKRFEYDEYDYVSKGDFSAFGGIDWLNGEFRKMGMDVFLTPDFDGNVHIGVVSRVVDRLSDMLKNVKSSPWNPLLNDFIKFVFFHLPYEEQNAGVNKKFLKNYTDTGFIAKVLLKEYTEGKHFKEYFSSLKKEVQKKVVDTLKTSPREPLHDHFLWLEGFKGFSLDIKQLYKENAEEFIAYFKSKNIEEKKAILKEIMDCEFVNEKVANFLNKKHMDIIREVGFNG